MDIIDSAEKPGVVTKSFRQLLTSEELPRIILKWIIILFALTILVLNILVLKAGMDSIVFWDMFDRDPSNVKIYRLSRVLFIVFLLFVNVMLVVGMVGARNKNILLSTIFTSVLCLFLVLHIIGALFSVELHITQKMIWKLFDNEYYSLWIAGGHAIFALVAIIHNFMLWRDEKKKKLKSMLSQTASAL